MNHSMTRTFCASSVLALLACGPTVASTGTDEDTEAAIDETTGDAEAADESSSGADAPATCGDGELDPGEACDDGNDEDADGCNVDCTVSGSVLWSYALPDGMRVAFIDVDGSDQLHALALDRTQMVHLVFDPEGELVHDEPLDVPLDAPEDARSVERVIYGFGLSSEGAPIVSFTDAYFLADGDVTARSHLVSLDPAWQHTFPPNSVPLQFDVAPDGRIVGEAGTIHTFAPDGTLEVSDEDASAGFVAAVADGLAIGKGGLTVYDASGSALWSEDWSPLPLSVISDVQPAPAGQGVAYGGVLDPDDLGTVQIRLSRFDASGEVSTWTWPEMPGDVGAVLRGLAVTPSNHVVIAVRDADAEHAMLWKLDAGYQTRWSAELDAPVRQLESDSTGALLVHTEDTVRKYAR